MIALIDVYDGMIVRPSALEFLYELLQHRDPKVNISHQDMPTFEQHRQLVNRRPYRCWYLIATQTQPQLPSVWVGSINATHFNEIGVTLMPNARGYGFGPAAIRELMRKHKPRPTEPAVRSGHWLANIAPGNDHSRYTFEKLGFKLIQQTFELPEEETHVTSDEKAKAGST